MTAALIYSGIKRVVFADPDTAKGMDTLQKEIDTSLKKIGTVDILNGNMITGLQTSAVSDEDVVINHLLGRPCKGFILVDSSGPLALYRSDTLLRLPEKQVILKAYLPVPAALSFSCWVF